MASGAGGNRAGSLGGIPVLRLRTTATALTGATDPTLAYGAIGANDSGLILLEVQGFTKFVFQICPEGPNVSGTAAGISTGVLPGGYTITVYQTIDPSIFAGWDPGPGNFTSFAGPSGGPMGSTWVPPGSWAKAIGPSDQSGTGNMTNPMVSTGSPILLVSAGAGAFRVALTNILGTPTAGATVYALGVP